MKKILEGIDIFGHHFNFSVFNKKEHRTSIGGILSLLTILCTIASTLYLGRDFYFRSNPKTSTDRIQNLNYPQYTINSSNFVYGFRVEDNHLNFIDESKYFQFKVVYNNSTITKNSVNGQVIQYDYPSINLNFSKCDFNKNLKYFNFISSNDTVDFRNFYCIDFSNNTSIGGYWTSNFTQYIDIQLLYCNSSNPNCNSKKDTLNYFFEKKIYLTMMTLKYFIDLTNYSNPLSNFLSYTYIQIDLNLSKKINCFMTPGQVTSNNGYFVDDKFIYSSFNLDYWTLDTINWSNINNKITLSRIYFTRYLDRFSRSYVKLSDLIPIIVSMLDIVSVFFSTIASFWNKFDWTNRMLNELFDFSDYYETKLIKIKERRSIIRKNLIKTNNQDQIIEIEENSSSSPKKLEIVEVPVSVSRIDKRELSKDYEKSNDELINNNIEKSFEEIKPIPNKKIRGSTFNKLKQILNNSNQIRTLNDDLIKILSEKTDFTYNLSFIIYLKNMCCKRTMTEKETNIYKIFKKGKKILKEKTDIVGFLKTMDEINEMKYVLFNRFQSLCFNFIRKPSLIEGVNEDRYSKFFNCIKGEESTQIKEIVNYFINQSKKRMGSVYNKAFLDIIDDDMKMVIEIIDQNN